MSRIRVLLGFLDTTKINILRSILLQDPNIEIVGEANNIVDVLLKTGSTHADVVALDLPRYGKDPGICSHLLAEYPDIKIFTVSQEGKITMYAQALVKREALHSSMDNLTDLIRLSMRIKDESYHDLGRLP